MEEDSVCAAEEQAVRDRDSRSAAASAAQAGLWKRFFRFLFFIMFSFFFLRAEAGIWLHVRMSQGADTPQRQGI